MKTTYPNTLKSGDTIMVIAPSSPSTYIKAPVHKTATERFDSMGINVVYAPNFDNEDGFDTDTGIRRRVDDIHTAFADKNINGIFTVLGGHHCNQLLQYLDFELIKNNPKVFCGFSDITALNNAILAQTGLITFCGPHYSTFGMQRGLEFTMQSFQNAIMKSEPFEIGVSDQWSDDPWYRDQENRTFIKNDGPKILHTGVARGNLVGGNLSTFALLQGTKYMPSDFDDIILFVEDDAESSQDTTIRQLAGILYQDFAKKIRGVLIGRPQKAEPLDCNALYATIKNFLPNVPVVAELDFGHTTPMLTIPTGAVCEMNIDKNDFKIKIYHE